MLQSSVFEYIRPLNPLAFALTDKMLTSWLRWPTVTSSTLHLEKIRQCHLGHLGIGVQIFTRGDSMRRSAVFKFEV